MNKKKTNDKNIVTGRNIYTDNKGRTVFYSKYRKQGFVIRAQTETAFKAFANRYLVAFIAVVFLELFLFQSMNVDNSIYLSIGGGVLCLAFMEYRWRKLLDSYTMIQNFEPEKHKNADEQLMEMGMGPLILRCLLYLALAILLILNIYMSSNITGPVLIIGSYVLSALAFYMCGRFILLMIKKSKLQN